MEKNNVEKRSPKRGNGRSHRTFDRRVSLVLPLEEYRALVALLPATVFQTVAELCRHILSGKLIIAHYYGKNGEGQDPLLDEATALLSDLKVYGGSIRTLAQNCYCHTSFETRLSYLETAIVVYEQVGSLVPILHEGIKKIAERWI